MTLFLPFHFTRRKLCCGGCFVFRAAESWCCQWNGSLFDVITIPSFMQIAHLNSIEKEWDTTWIYRRNIAVMYHHFFILSVSIYVNLYDCKVLFLTLSFSHTEDRRNTYFFVGKTCEKPKSHVTIDKHQKSWNLSSWVSLSREGRRTK